MGRSSGGRRTKRPGRVLADAEEQARATREASQEMALRIQGETRTRTDRLSEEVRFLEERRSRILTDLREVAAQLSDLIPQLDPTPRETELLDALEPERRS